MVRFIRFIDKEDKLSFSEKKEELKKIIDTRARRYLLEITEKSPEVKKKLISEIVDHSKKYSKYDPKYLLFTGQHLGSFVRFTIDSFSSTGTIIENDVDVFIPLYNIDGCRSNHDISIEDRVQVVSSYDSIDTINKYNIVSTDYFYSNSISNNINVTLVSHPILSRFSGNKKINKLKLKFLAEEIISKFDINSVKIGILYDVTEDKISDVIIHDDFINFIFSGYLQLSSTTNYFKSFPRIIKKIREFNNIPRDLKSFDYFIKTNQYIDPNSGTPRENKLDSLCICEVYSKSTLEPLGDIVIKLKVNYPDYKEIIKYFDYLIAIHKYLVKVCSIDQKTARIGSPTEIRILKNKKLVKLYEEGFAKFLEFNGFEVNFHKNEKVPDNTAVYFSVRVDKPDINYEAIVEKSFILNEYIDFYYERYSETGIFPSNEELRMIAKLQILYNKMSKKKIHRIYDYLLSLTNIKTYALTVFSEIIKYNLVDIPLGDLKIIKQIEEHSEIYTLFYNLLKLYDVYKSLKIIQLIEDIKNEVIEQRIGNKKIQEMLGLEAISKLYSSRSLTKLDIHIPILETGNIDVIRPYIEKIINKIIDKNDNLKNEVVLPKEFNAIRINIDHYFVEELATTFDLRYEGIHMHHCVGGYVDYVKGYRSSIFKLESKEDKTFRYTCEINPGSYAIVQIKGKQNKSVKNTHKEIVDKLIKKVIDEMKRQKRHEIVKEKKGTIVLPAQPAQLGQPGQLVDINNDNPLL